MSRNPFSRYEVKTGPVPFPSKFSALPGIADSPPPNDDNQLLPYKPPVPPLGTQDRISQLRGEMLGDGDERFRQLESRVNIAEKSNRALLEEVVRLQSELKTTVKRNEELIRDDRGARSQMENSLRASNDLVTQLMDRLKRTEDKLHDEHSAVVALANHSKNIEQSILGSQQELLSRREVQSNRLNEIQGDLEDTRRGKDSVERVVYNLVDEMRQLRAKMDTQNLDYTATTNDLRNRSKRLEDEARSSRMESLRKQGETQSYTEQHNTQLKAQVETRLSELRDVVVELRNKQDSEIQERRMLEQQTQLKVTDLQSALAEQTRQHDAAVHALDVMRREKEHAAETERIKLQGRIAEVAEEVIKKVLNREMKLREETSNRFAQIEQALNKHAEEQLDFEKKIRNNIENDLEESMKKSTDDVRALHEKLKQGHKKQKDTLHQLNESLSLMEKEFEELRKRQDKLIAAEIHTRKKAEKEVEEKIDSVQEKLSLATTTLQQAVGGVSNQISTQENKFEKNITNLQQQLDTLASQDSINDTINKLKQEMKEMIEQSKDSGLRSLTDMDARIISLNTKIAHAEDTLENKISTTVRRLQINEEATELAEAATVQSKNIREKIDSVTLWQEVTQQTIKELQSQITKNNEEVYACDEKQKLLKSEMNTRLTAEADIRLRDLENIREEIKKVEDQIKDLEKKAALKSDIDEVQASIRRLAESLQTMKTVLGMKIQSEQKLRLEEMASLQDDVVRLRVLVEPLLRNKPDPRVFVKPISGNNDDSGEIERASRVVNKWSLYTAYRWQHWKSRWMYMKWAKDAAQNRAPTEEPPVLPPEPPSPQKSPPNTPTTSPKGDAEIDLEEKTPPGSKRGSPEPSGSKSPEQDDPKKSPEPEKPPGVSNSGKSSRASSPKDEGKKSPEKDADNKEADNKDAENKDPPPPDDDQQKNPADV